MPYQLAKAVMARFGWLDNSTHAFSLVHNELSWWGLKALCIYISHICIVAVTTALDHHQAIMRC
jgi:hypothetical protein